MNQTVKEAARKPRLTPDQIGLRLETVVRELNRGNNVADACKIAGVSVPSYYRWSARRSAAEAEGVPFASEREKIRETVLSAAKKVFLVEGFNASLERVAKEAGIARQTVYNQFGSKDRLFGEVVQLLYQKLVPPILVVERDGDFASFLELCGRHLIEFLLNPEVVSLMRITMGEFRNHPELAAVAYAMRSSRNATSVTRAIAKRLELEISEGRIDPVNPDLAAEHFVGSFTGYARHRSLIGEVPERHEVERAMQFSVTLFLRGLGYKGRIPD